MAHVSVSINGRQYRMACEDGQENHLVWLSGDLDRRIRPRRRPRSRGSLGGRGPDIRGQRQVLPVRPSREHDHDQLLDRRRPERLDGATLDAQLEG